MVMKLKIDEEFRSKLPVPDDEQRAALEKQIVEEGCLDPIRVWAGKDVILDGYTRYDICDKNGVKFKVTEIALPSREAALAWIVRNQLNRRNLTDERRRYFIGELYNIETHGHGGDRKSSASQANGKKGGKKVAKSQGVSERTARRAGKRTKAINAAADKVPELRDAILDEKAAASTKELEEIAAAEPEKAKAKAKDVLEGKNKKGKKKADEPKEPEPVKVHDGNGKLVPAASQFIEVFADREWFLEKVKLYKKELADVRRMAHSPGGAALHVEECVARLKGLIAEIEQRTPHAVCLICKGGKMDPAEPKKECPGCGGLGWQDAFSYSIDAKKGGRK